MNWMTPWGPIHFCMDEARMLFWGLMGALPFMGLWVALLRRACKRQHKKECCDHTKDNHTHM